MIFALCPGIGGIGLIERIKMCRKMLPILVFSMQSDPHIAVRALKAGVFGYITKDKDMAILLDAIRKVADGGKYIDPIVADQLIIISNKTVSSHKKRLMEKMHFSGMADLMRCAVQRRLFDEVNQD